MSLTVTDTRLPVISSVTPSSAVLTPPNHQLVPITLSVVATDDGTPSPVCSIAGVSSNEPQSGLDKGDVPNDWSISGPLGVQLRAERSDAGNGRTYTIQVGCVDPAGNRATASTVVTVPKPPRKP